MRVLKKTWISALIWMGVCGSLLSCKPSGMQTPPEKLKTGGSAAQTEMKTTELSREQIIAVANRVARDHGRNPKQTKVHYDEQNAYWEGHTHGIESDLAGRDFQAVGYWHQPPIPEGSLWVLVDRNTGEVLRVVELP